MKQIIRFATPDDASGILEIYAPFVTETAVTFEEIVPSAAEIAARINQISEKLPYLVYEIDGKVAGYAYACDFRTRSAYRWIKELSVYIHPEFRRRNIARALYYSVIQLLTSMGVTSALACITVPNEESVKFHENFGFRKVGEFEANGYKLGKWHHVGWWEMHLDPDHKAPVDQVIPINNLPESFRDDIFLKGSGMILL
jgi:L-amino acid N-acyltransferase YncA